MYKKTLTVLICVIALLIASRPVFRPTLFFVHDYLHMARIAEAARGLEAGHLPVRWSQAFNFGYGMPLFSFYAPLPSYVGAVFVFIGLPLLFSFKLVYVGVSLFTLVGAYLLGKYLYNRLGGVLLAILFTLAPYRAVNLYVRGALSEAWGMAFYPWILLGLILTIKKHKWGVPCLSLSMAGLALSHNLSFMIFLPMALLWGGGLALVVPVLSHQQQLINQKKERYLSKVMWSYARILAGVLLGVGISAFYLIPAYVEKNLVQVEKLTTSYYFNFHLHFLYLRQFITNYWGYGGSAWGPEDGMSFFLGFGLIFGLLVSGLFLSIVVIKLLGHRVSKSGASWPHSWRVNQTLVCGTVVCILSGSLGALALLLTTEKTVVLWNSIALLRFVQFPWRFLSVASLFLAIAATFISLLPWKKLQLGLVVLLIGLLFWGGWSYFWPSYFLDHSDALYYGDSNKITQNLSTVLVDYVPVGMPLDSSPVHSLVSPDDIDGSIETIANRPQEKVFKITSNTPQLVPINLAWYPGWQAYIDGTLVPFEKPMDTVKITVPTGEHVVSLAFTETPLRQASNLVSLLAISILLAYGIFRGMKVTWLKHN